MYFLRIAWFKHGWAFGIVYYLIPAFAVRALRRIMS
jgi:hypothetical protein